MFSENVYYLSGIYDIQCKAQRIYEIIHYRNHREVEIIKKSKDGTL